MANNTLEHLFEEQLKDIYYAEKLIVKSLPKMAKKTTSEALIEAFEEHLAETEMQIERLEQVFEKLGKKAQGKKCPAMDGLVEEAEEHMKELEESAVLDAALVAAAQAVEHYEIARYGTLIAWAEKLGYDDEIIDLLAETLEEEKQTDENLSALAESEINDEADEEEDEEMEDEEEDDAPKAASKKRKVA